MNQTNKEKLLEEFEVAIVAIFGDLSDEEYNEDTDTDISAGDIDAIARKVKFYMDR